MKDLASAIINKLTERFGQFPRTGIAAGQAVAEAYFQVMGVPVVTAMNDLDIFMHPSRSHRTKYDNPMSVYKTTDNDLCSSVAIKLDMPSYNDEGFSYAVNKLHYTVVGSERYGDINIIEVDTSDADLIAETIVKGFDLNICMIGLDLETSDLFIADEFTSFLETKTLEICNFSTPAPSLLRFFKKLSYQGVTGNTDEAIRLTSLSIQLSQYGTDCYTRGCGMGEYRTDQFKGFEREWSKSFTLRKYFFPMLDGGARPDFSVYGLEPKLVIKLPHIPSVATAHVLSRVPKLILNSSYEQVQNIINKITFATIDEPLDVDVISRLITFTGNPPFDSCYSKAIELMQMKKARVFGVNIFALDESSQIDNFYYKIKSIIDSNKWHMFEPASINTIYDRDVSAFNEHFDSERRELEWKQKHSDLLQSLGKIKPIKNGKYKIRQAVFDDFYVNSPDTISLGLVARAIDKSSSNIFVVEHNGLTCGWITTMHENVFSSSFVKWVSQIDKNSFDSLVCKALNKNSRRKKRKERLMRLFKTMLPKPRPEKQPVRSFDDFDEIPF